VKAKDGSNFKEEKLGAGDGTKKVGTDGQRDPGLEKKLSEKSFDSQNRPRSGQGSKPVRGKNGNSKSGTNKGGEPGVLHDKENLKGPSGKR
jgi:hypothetical protein